VSRPRKLLAGLFGSRTLTGRLALGGITWIGLWAIALLTAFNLLLSHVLSGQVDAALKARSEAVAATVHVQSGTLRIAAGNDEALDAGTSIYYGRTLVEGSDLSPALVTELVQRGQRTADRQTLGPVKYLAVPITSNRRQVGTIVVSSDIGARSRTEWIVGGASVAVIAMMLLFTFFALRATIGRAMRPVRVMGEQASAWGEADLDRRFDPDAGPLELRRLALTLNELLERIAATLRHERQFTAELSHELRTPLAHLHADVDLLATAADDDLDPEPVSADDLERLRTSIRRLESLVESALAPARVRQPAVAGLGRISDVLSGLTEPAPTTPSDGEFIALTVNGRTDLVLSVDADVARRALAPVVENAWRYARHGIQIEVTAVGGLASITVADDGGRLPADAVDDIFEAGFRADPDDGHAGAGLGLALTRRIARAAGGDATASVCAGRSAITLTLPCLNP
jgi:signal transduction histidine kinase